MIPEPQLNPKAPVPPEVVKLIEPLLKPLQLTFIELFVSVIALGCVIVTDLVEVQLFASETVTLYVPGANPVLF